MLLLEQQESQRFSKGSKGTDIGLNFKACMEGDPLSAWTVSSATGKSPHGGVSRGDNDTVSSPPGSHLPHPFLSLQPRERKNGGGVQASGLTPKLYLMLLAPVSASLGGFQRGFVEDCFTLAEGHCTVFWGRHSGVW